MNGRAVLLVAIGTVAVMGLGVAVAWELERTGVRELQRARVAGRFDAPPADMNGIEMSLLSPGLPTREKATEEPGPIVQTYALRDRQDPRGVTQPEPASGAATAPGAAPTTGAPPAHGAPAPGASPPSSAPPSAPADGAPGHPAPAPGAAPSQAAGGLARERLQSYGWNDRAQRTVHIPLARAVELYLARERDAARAPAGGADPLPRSANQPSSGGQK